ncbi:MAG TPA: hypothetical protein VJ965_08075 [Anaerolineales bacterium]|nr:hypothetical protein [Anaerolineales bacterium]
MPEWMWFVVVGVPAFGGLILTVLRQQDEDRQLWAAVGVGALTAAALALVIFWPTNGLVAYSVTHRLDGMILFGFFLLLAVNIIVPVVLLIKINRKTFFKPRWFKYFFWFTGSLAGIGLGTHWLMIYPNVVLFGFSFIQLFFPTELIVDVRRDRRRRVNEDRYK